jgi:phospholipid/cholesterol/gamma-HCH transport system ATP-binding protein
MIRIRGLRKSFGSKVVLDGIDLDVERGRSTVIIGGSGMGKSVLIKTIIGLLKPDGGRIVVDGIDTRELDAAGWTRLRKKFGMLFQGAALFDSMTVGENVAFPMVMHFLLSPEEIRERVREKLSLVGLRDVEHLRPSQLSGGMRKRVGLARALAIEPEILLYDEPTTGLDPITGQMINRLIVEMRERLGVTSITITHDMKSAYFIGDEIAMLYKGKIIQEGAPEEIRATRNPIVRRFIEGRARLEPEEPFTLERNR